VIEHTQGGALSGKRARRYGRPRRARLRTTGLGVAALAGVLAFTVAAAYASSSYSDPAGDANEAPDIAEVTVDDAGAGAVSVRVSFSNFRVLPPDSQVLLRFDLDQNENTGVEGDEAAIRYSSDGTLAFFRWDGADLVPYPVTDMSATFADGIFTYTVDRAQLAGASSFALIAVAARRQQVGIGFLFSTDFAPGSGRNVWASPGEAVFPDPDGDHDVAADVTSISVSDSGAGRVVFRLTTANYQTLPPDKLIGIGVDLRGRPPTDDELFVGYVSGTSTVEVDVEERGIVQPLETSSGVTASHANGVLTISLPRKLLDGASAFGFGVISLDLVGPGESEGEEFEGEVEALDTAPDDLSKELYAYRLTNPGTVRLRTGAVSGLPARPQAGRSFTVRAVVRRLDSYRVLHSGSVRCTASVGRARIASRGRFRGGRAECALRIPDGAASRVLRGTMTVRVSGASARQAFSFVVE
jgi:hypothetical protein